MLGQCDYESARRSNLVATIDVGLRNLNVIPELCGEFSKLAEYIFLGGIVSEVRERTGARCQRMLRSGMTITPPQATTVP